MNFVCASCTYCLVHQWLLHFLLGSSPLANVNWSTSLSVILVWIHHYCLAHYFLIVDGSFLGGLVGCSLGCCLLLHNMRGRSILLDSLHILRKRSRPWITTTTVRILHAWLSIRDLLIARQLETVQSGMAFCWGQTIETASVSLNFTKGPSTPSENLKFWGSLHSLDRLKFQFPSKTSGLSVVRSSGMTPTAWMDYRLQTSF